MVKCVMIEMNMDNYLTADEARKISCGWQTNEVARLVKATLDMVAEEAHKGQRKIYVQTGCNNDGINRDLYVSAMQSLGYTLASRNGTGFWWEW